MSGEYVDTFFSEYLPQLFPDVWKEVQHYIVSEVSPCFPPIGALL